MTDRPYRVWVDSSPVFGATSGHWGPMFDSIEEWQDWPRGKRMRRGIVLVLYRGEQEVSRQTCEGS